MKALLFEILSDILMLSIYSRVTDCRRIA